MSAANRPGPTRVLLGFALVGAVAVSAAGVYLARQTLELSRTSQDLAAEVRGLKAALAQHPTAAPSPAPVAAADRCAASGGIADFVDALRTQLSPLSKRMQEMEASLRRQSTPRPPVASLPGAPPDTGDALLLPLPPTVNLDAMRQWQEHAPQESKDRLETILRRNAEKAQAQIAAETDPERPDPQILMRILEQSQADLASELSAVLSPQEYETFFPSLPGQGPAPVNRDNTIGNRRTVK